MSAKSSIQWTDRTWNPTTGCTRVSPGCDHCYAFQLHDQRYVAKRAGKAVNGAQYDKPFSEVQLLPKRLNDPLGWRAPSRVFVDSMSDLFHPDVPESYISDVFDVMAVASQHTFQVLTKRPERMRDILKGWEGYRGAPNVWLGVSVEDQERADERIVLLLDTPAAVRFISAEPLLGPLNLRDVRGYDALQGDYPPPDAYGHRFAHLDWVIVGGESGKHARGFDLAWARSLRDQCADTGVAYFLKQLGNGPLTYPVADFPVETKGHAGDPAEWPADLQNCRAFPEVALL